MNPEVKDKWLERLRSGEIPQVKNRLAEDAGPGRCCLGVLCDIAVEEGVIPSPVSVDGATFYAGERTGLPAPVMEWAGLPGGHSHAGAEVELPETVWYVDAGVRSGATLITALNDFSSLGFAGIADVIEKQL